MRTVLITENDAGMVASDDDGQFAMALNRPDNRMTYISFLHGDEEPVIHVTSKTENWRSQVSVLMGL